MKRIFLLMAVIAISFPSFGRVICDTTCHAPEDEFRNFAVVSPVGRSMVTHTDQQLIDNTRNVTWPQILAGLTTPITQAESLPATQRVIKCKLCQAVTFLLPPSKYRSCGTPSWQPKGILRSVRYNLINLPTGVYFVRVAGYKGVACKVVKN